MDVPLKVLITDPHLRGGGQVRYVTNLARELVGMGHAVTIGCRTGSVLIDRARETNSRAAAGFDFRGGLRPASWRGDIERARRLFEADAPDVVHVNGSQDHWVCAAANRLSGRARCVLRTRHNTYPVARHALNRLLNRDWTDYQVVVCDTVRETLARHPAFDPARLCTIHNGVDAEEFKPDAAAREQARAAFGFGPEHLVCGIAARLVEAKGHVYLFQAAARVRRELPELRMLVLGQGDKQAELRRLAAELGIDDLVLFAGFRDDMARCVQAFDVGIQPSIDCDTSSFSLKEQMAAEKPVIASDYGGLTEIVTGGVEGLVTPTGSVEPLADALRTLARDPELRRRMGRAGRERVLHEFTIQAFAAKTVAAYRRAIEIHRERTAH